MPSANLTLGSVHVNVPLTNLAIAAKFPEMAAERIFPVIPVTKEADIYYEFNKEELADFDVLRAPGALVNEMPWDVTTETYTAEEYALGRLIPKRVADNADPPVRPAITTVKKLKRVLLIEQERRVQAIVQSALIITNTAVPATKWDAASGATIEKDIDTAKNAVRLRIGIRPNAILMSEEVADAVKRWLKASAQTTYSEWLDKNELPPTLWKLETIVAGAVRNSANAAQTEVLANIWNDNVCIFYKEPSPSLDAMSLGYIFRSSDWLTKDYWVDERNGRFYECSVIEDEKLVAADAGYLWTDVLT